MMIIIINLVMRTGKGSATVEKDFDDLVVVRVGGQYL